MTLITNYKLRYIIPLCLMPIIVIEVSVFLLKTNFHIFDYYIFFYSALFLIFQLLYKKEFWGSESLQKLKKGLNNKALYIKFICYFIFSIVFNICVLSYIKHFLPYTYEYLDNLMSNIENSIANTPFIYSFFVLVILAPLVEEFLFRRLMYERLNFKYGSKIALVLPTFIFSLLHIDFLNSCVFSILMVFAYKVSGTILLPILFHFMNNLIALLLTKISEFDGVLQMGFSLYLTTVFFVALVIVVFKQTVHSSRFILQINKPSTQNNH